MKKSIHQTTLTKTAPRAARLSITLVLLLGAAVVALPDAARAQTPTLTVLHDFNTTDGSSPDHGLVQASDGNFYGTTPTGVTAGLGTVFQITPAGNFTVLASFTGTNGSYAECALVQGNDGLLYGTTQSGGPLPTDNGTIFKVTTDGDLQTLFAFPQTIGGPLNGAYLNGRSPAAGLVQGTDGEFYGTNTLEGVRSPTGGFGDGTVFKISSGGDFQTLFTFYNSNDPNNPEGGDPRAPLVLDQDGSFYSTTYQGGTETEGTIFRVTASGVQTNLYNFNHLNGSGGAPFGGLVLGPDNKYYGMTEAGGSNNLGTYYRISHEGVFELLGNFTGAANGGQPFDEMVVASDGNLYGTTSSGGSDGVGTIFQLTTAGVLTTVYTFPNSQALGAFPRGTLIQGKDGALYGTTLGGGASNVGTVFRLDLNFPNPLTLLSAASVKGGFGIDLPLTGTTGIEDRRSSAGTYSITLTFNNNLTAVAAVTSSCGTVVSGLIDGTNPHQFVVSLTGVFCNAQDVTVTLTNVQDDHSNILATASATMGLLLGDVDGDGSVTTADVDLVRASKGQPADATNFRRDVNPDGTINRSDYQRVKHQLGTSLP